MSSNNSIGFKEWSFNMGGRTPQIQQLGHENLGGGVEVFVCLQGRVHFFSPLPYLAEGYCHHNVTRLSVH